MRRKTMKALRLLLIVAICIFFAETAIAANHFVRSGASGSGNGNDWTNAYTALPATLVRGDTYYIAGGSYAGRTFNTGASGTSVITIKGATVADHGIDTGWSSSYSVENSQAVWSGTFTFSTSYWIFDGSAGATWSRTASSYGFLINAPSSSNFSLFMLNGTNTTGIKIAHVAATAPSIDTNKFFIGTPTSGSSVYNCTISNNYSNGWSNFVYGMSGKTGWIIEKNIVLNGFSSANAHGEDINNDCGSPSYDIRWNWFENRQQGTACIVSLNCTASAYYIYGNVFKNMRYGDGCITGITNGYGSQIMSGAVVNNTFIDVMSPYNYGGWIGYNVTSNVYNNLLYSMPADVRGLSGAKDYNAYYSTTNTPSETHGQAATGNPFVNLNNYDVSLLAPTNDGYHIDSSVHPYNIDAFGRVRGADGVWDRGALEYGGSSSTTRPAPVLIQ
jgi:hypothetical protein